MKKCKLKWIVEGGWGGGRKGKGGKYEWRNNEWTKTKFYYENCNFVFSFGIYIYYFYHL